MREAIILGHQNIVQDGIKEIYTSRKYSDIILITCGQQYHCHRIVLYAFIPKWYRSLIGLSPHSKVPIGNIGDVILEKLLMLLYLGQTEMDKESYPKFKNQLKDLEVKGDFEEIIQEDSVSIKMENHSQILVDGFHDCFSRKFFTDYSLMAAENENKFEGHRLVLSLFSTEVDQLFGEPEGPICSFFEGKYMYYVLKLIYRGYVSIWQHDFVNSNIFEQAFHSLSCKGELQIENMDFHPEN